MFVTCGVTYYVSYWFPICKRKREHVLTIKKYVACFCELCVLLLCIFERTSWYMVAAVVVFILFTVSTMSDEESSSGTPATVSVHTTASNQAGNIHRPSLPQVKPPPPLNLADCSAKRWKLWKQTWLNFAIVSKFSTQGEAYQKALFLCTIGQSALENQRISVHCERRFKQGRHDNRQVWPILHRWRKRDVRALQIQPTQWRSWWKFRCFHDRPQKHDRHR